MWVGEYTESCYEDVFSLVCEKHKDRQHEIKDKDEIVKMLKEAFNVVRMKSMSVLFEDLNTYYSKDFRKWSNNFHLFGGIPLQWNVDKERNMREIVLIDSVSAYTLALFSKLCCICQKVENIEDLKNHRNNICRDLPFVSKPYTSYSIDGVDAFFPPENYPVFYKEVKLNFEIYSSSIVHFAYVVASYSFASTFGDDIKSFMSCIDDTRTDILKDRGDLAFNNRDYKYAITMYSLLLNLNPYSFYLYENLAEAHLALNEHLLVEMYSRFALVINPECCKAYCRLAAVLCYHNCIHKGHLIASFGLRQCSDSSCKDFISLKKYVKDTGKEKECPNESYSCYRRDTKLIFRKSSSNTSASLLKVKESNATLWAGGTAINSKKPNVKIYTCSTINDEWIEVLDSKDFQLKVKESNATLRAGGTAINSKKPNVKIKTGSTINDEWIEVLDSKDFQLKVKESNATLWAGGTAINSKKPNVKIKTGSTINDEWIEVLDSKDFQLKVKESNATLRAGGTAINSKKPNVKIYTCSTINDEWIEVLDSKDFLPEAKERNMVSHCVEATFDPNTVFLLKLKVKESNATLWAGGTAINSKKPNVKIKTGSTINDEWIEVLDSKDFQLKVKESNATLRAGGTAINSKKPNVKIYTCSTINDEWIEVLDSKDFLLKVKESNATLRAGGTAINSKKPNVKIKTGSTINDEWIEVLDSKDFQLCALQISNTLTKGHSAVKLKNMTKAMSHFSEALEMLKDVVKHFDKDEFILVDIKFACGYGYYKCNTLESLDRAIELFKEVVEMKGNLALVYYFLGLLFKTFHKFQTALTYFKTVSSMSQETFLLKYSDWFNEDCLKEFKYENIQASLKNDIAECMCPPSPDAICRFKDCDFVTIYFCDLTFKKCTCLYCQDRCVLHYHITCWKSMKEAFAKNDKDFLDGSCFTPDCKGLIIKIEIIGKDGLVEKEFLSKNNCKPKKQHKQRQMSIENKDQKEHEKKKNTRSLTVSKSSEAEAEFDFRKRHSKENIKFQRPRKSREISNKDRNLILDSNMSVNSEEFQSKTNANEKTATKDENTEYKCFPRPDAVCRYKDCPISRKIYFSDPLCEVIICVCCQELCAIPYHVSCWKSFKRSLSKTDDDFLNAHCFTPDCDSVITKVDIVGKDGIQERHFTYKDSYKPKKRIKQRKLKLEKKQEKKERKKQEVLTRPLSGNFEDWTDEPEPTTKNMFSRCEIHNKTEETFVKDIHFTSDEDNLPGFARSGIMKAQGNGLADEKERFVEFSRYGVLRAQDRYFLSSYDFPSINSTSHCNERKFTSSSLPNDFKDSNEGETALNTHDLCEDDYEEELKAIINSHFVNFLRLHGFVNLSDPMLFKEMCNLSQEANDLIDRKGGFLSFFQDNAEFVILNDNFCLFDDVKDFCESGYVDHAKQNIADEGWEKVSSNRGNIKKVQSTAKKSNDMFNYMDASHSKNIIGLSEVDICKNQVANRIRNNSSVDTRSKKCRTSTAMYSSIEDDESSSNDNLPHQKTSRNDHNYSRKLSQSSGNLSTLQMTAMSMKNGTKSHSIIDIGTKLQKSSEAQLPKAKDSESSLSLYEYVADHSLVKSKKKSKASANQKLNLSIAHKDETNDLIADGRNETKTSMKGMEEPKTMNSTIEKKLMTEKYKESADKEKLHLENETLRTKIKNSITQEHNEQLQNNKTEDEQLQNNKTEDEQLQNNETEDETMKTLQTSESLKNDEKGMEEPKTMNSTIEKKRMTEKYKESADKEKLHLENETLRTKIKNSITQEHNEQLQNNKTEDDQLQNNKTEDEQLQNNETEDETMKTLQTGESLKNAELQILYKKKSEYKEDFKACITNVKAKLDELTNGLNQMEYMYSIMHDSLRSLRDKFVEYIRQVYVSNKKFIDDISDQVKEIQNGASLSQLTKLKVPTFLPLPTMDTILNEMKSQLVSSPMQQAFASSLQNNEQLLPMLLQNLFPIVLPQNFQATMPCVINPASKDSDVPLEYYPKRVSISSQSDASITSQASVNKFPPNPVPVKDFFDGSVTTTFNGKCSQPMSFTGSDASSTTKKMSLPMHTGNRRSKHSMSSKISEDCTKFLLQTEKSSRESISSGSCLDNEDSSCTKSTSYKSSDSLKKAVSSTEYISNQWSSLNPEGKKRYDREFLLQMQSQPLSLKKPLNLPNLDIIKEKAQLYKLCDVNRVPSVVHEPQRASPHGINQRSRQGRDKPKKVTSISSSLNQAVKLHESSNASKPQMTKPETDNKVEVKNQEVYKKVRDILNKLTPQKFDTLVKQVKDLEIITEERLKTVVHLVFEKAIDEPSFSLYASMCKQLALLKVPLPEQGFINFRKLLLRKCQKELEQDNRDELKRIEKMKLIEDAPDEKKKQLTDEFAEEEKKDRKRQLGSIRFIGELFKCGMLTEIIMHECVTKLLRQGDEDSLECLCRLLTTVGKELEKRGKKMTQEDFDTKKTLMNNYMTEMQKVVDKCQTSSRVRFMLQDVIDLSKTMWKPQRNYDNTKTIDQNHKEVESEADEQQQLLQSISFFYEWPPDSKKSNSGSSTVKSSHQNDKEKGKRLKAIVHQAMATLKKMHPDVTDSEIMSYIKQYRTENKIQGHKLPFDVMIADIEKIMLQIRKKRETNVGNSKASIAALFTTQVAATISKMDKILKSKCKDGRDLGEASNDSANSPSCSSIVNNMQSHDQLMHYFKQNKKIYHQADGDVLEDPDSGKPNAKSSTATEKAMRMITAPRIVHPKLLANKSLTAYSKPIRRPIFRPVTPVRVWATNPKPDAKFVWNRETTEHCCSICLEDMTVISAYRAECGHKFHLECIKKWLKKQSNCPCCRVHLLLRDEFPELS